MLSIQGDNFFNLIVVGLHLGEEINNFGLVLSCPPQNGGKAMIHTSMLVHTTDLHNQSVLFYHSSQ